MITVESVLFYNEAVFQWKYYYIFDRAGIGGLLTYLSTRIGRKGMEVNLRILQEKAKAWEEKEQRWQEENGLIRDNERLKENLRQTEENGGAKRGNFANSALQKEQFQNLANDILEDKPGVLRKRTGKI
ncbi:MAG: hypothetical protein ACLU30_06810 [Odoribacter splanchnicus]